MARTNDSNLEEKQARAQVLLHKDGFSIQDYRKIARLGEGTFGACRRCARPIAPERLEALPWAAHCIDCQREIARGRP